MPATTIIASAAVAATMVQAPVTNVEPIIRNEVVTVQTQNCHTLPAYSNRESIVGGIVGGLIGSQIGRDEGTRRVMTGVGAVIGSQVGYDSYGPGQRCAPAVENRAVPTVAGYRVTYMYNGAYHVAQLPYNPGQYVTIQQHHSIR